MSMKDELLSIVSTWDEFRLNEYIDSLERRITETRALVTELKAIRKKRRPTKSKVETGIRGGK